MVIVTGAAHGIGRSIAHAFAAGGARVWGCDLLPAELAATAALAREGELQVRTLDVSDRRSVSDFVAEVERTHGSVDVLVNNAGGVRGQVGRPLEEVAEEDWKGLFAANLDGAFFFSQAVAPGMKANRSGRIVNISSGAGLTVSLTGIQGYAAAKAALIGLTRQLALELGPWGVTVNSIAPGFIRSNPSSERQWQAYGPEKQQALLENLALRRLGNPEDIAHGVLFIASPYASWITGQVVAIDGGRL